MNRRIAVVQVPRGQRSRLGIIRQEDWIAGPNTTALNSWTPLQALVPTLLANGSSTTPEEWQAQLLVNRALRTLTTPGTVSYTPAPTMPNGSQIEPPWSSWQTDACNPQSGTMNAGAPSPTVAAAAAAPPAAGGFDNTWLIVTAAIGAAASLVYLANQNKGRAR